MKNVMIKNILKNSQSWKKEYRKRYEYVKQTIGTKHCFDKCFRVKLSDCEIILPIADYIVNLIMWRPMIKYDMIPCKKTIFDCDNITQSSIKKYLDDVYVRPLRSKVDTRTLNLELAKIIEKLKRIVEDFGLIMGITYNIYQFIELAHSNERFDELIHTHLPKGMQPKEIEVFAKSRLNEVVDILKKSNTGLAPLLNSGTGINLAQFQELAVVIGNKPDLEGNTYPVPIDTNILIGGLDTPAHFTLDSSSGRKALIMNKKYTGKSGYFSKKLNLLNLDTVLDLDPDSDCHTTRYLKFKIDNMDSLLRIEGRHYKSKKDSMFLKTVAYTDTQLIGKTIYLRSPIFCKHEKICHKCYGELANLNKNINIGLIASTIISSRFTQNILSAKHSLMTNSQKIEITEGFEDYFVLDGNQLLLDINNIDNTDDLNLVIKSKSLDVDSDDDYDEDEKQINIFDEIMCTEFAIQSVSTNKVLIVIKEKNDIQLRLSDYMSNLIDRYGKDERIIRIPLSEIDEEEVIGTYDVSNHELTKTLNMVKGILEKEDRRDKDGNPITDIDEIVYEFNRLLIDGKIYAHLIHAEIICRNLIRDAYNTMNRPDWSKKDVEYIIYTVQKALMKHPSPFISLSFERVEEQLKNVLTFKKRKSSMLDQLFMEHYNQKYDFKEKDLLI